MSSDGIQLNRRTVLVSLVVIGLAAAAAGAGTMALFSDTESSSDNTVSAGTLDLTVDSNNGNPSTTLTVSDVAPGDSNSASSNISNVGSLDGYVDSVTVLNVAGSENGLEEPEAADGDSGSPGELNSTVTVTISVDTNNDGTGDVQVVSGTPDSITGTHSVDGVPLNSSETNKIIVEWTVPSDAGNSIQGDNTQFDIEVGLNQTDS